MQAMINQYDQFTKPSQSVSADMIKMMEFHALEYQADEKLSLKSMWELPQENFLRKRADFVDYIEWKFHSVVEHPYFTVKGRKLARDIPYKWIHGKA